jgi:hypothetical protein
MEATNSGLHRIGPPTPKWSASLSLAGREASDVAIKFHYHTARRDVPRLGIERGDPLCHVYSDESLEELLAWGRRHKLKPEWLHRRTSLPHFDLFGEWLDACGDGVESDELRADIRRWRRG